jgi:hypothetical protein
MAGLLLTLAYHVFFQWRRLYRVHVYQCTRDKREDEAHAGAHQQQGAGSVVVPGTSFINNQFY